MKIKPLAPHNAGRIWMSLDGSPIADDWHMNGNGGAFGTIGVTRLGELGPITDAVPPVISLTTSGVAYTQNFDALSNTAGSTTNNLTIDGWAMTETGGGARDNEQYAVDTGGSTTGDTYSYGAAAATDRALGELRSGTLIPNFGASFTNTTGATITSLLISYDGEQWRFGGVHSTIADKLDFQISFDATDLTTGTWLDINNLDFLAPVTTGSAGALDGNAAANRTAISFNVTTVNGNAVSIANGATFWIRWQDVDATGADDGLAIDNFSITPTTGAALPNLTINDVSISEGDAGTTSYTFTVSLSAPAGPGGVTFDIATADGTAQDGNPGSEDSDYTAKVLTSQTIPAGSSTYAFTVLVNGDAVVEPNETFFVNVTNVTGATVTDGQGQGTIVNDDAAPPNLSIDDVSISEGDAGTTSYTFTVSLSAPAGPGGVHFDIATADGTAQDGNPGSEDSDYAAKVLTSQTIPAGSSTYSFTVLVNGDAVVEPNETFFVNITNVTGATVTDGQGQGMIVNDDSPPTVSIGDASIVEGNSGVSFLVFTVSLDHSATGTVTVDYATSDGSATAGIDYVAHSGQVSFAPGETSQTVSIPIIGDTAPENNETFTVTLTAPTNATLGDDTATGTITNDDGSAYYSLASGSFTQNWTNTGLITANDDWSNVPFIIGYRGDDLTTATGTDARTITTTSAVIDVNANQSNPNTFTTGGVTEFEIADPTIALQGSGTADAPYIVLFMDATGRSNVRLQANLRDIDGSVDDAAQQINVQYRTDNGAWINVPGAYFADVTTGGSATQVTALDVVLPSAVDGVATVQIRIMTTNAVGNDELVGIDDIVVSSQVSAPVLSIADTAVFEGNSGTTPISFTVTRSGDSAGAVSATWTATFGSGPFDAQANDFAAGQLFTGTVSFADGQTSQTITLNVQGDVNPEGHDGFTVTLSNPVGGAIADGSATGTIINDDGSPPLVSIDDVMVTEGDSGTSLMTFTVTRTGGTGAFDVDFHTANGTGIEPGDYLATSGTLHFNAGQMTRTISVTINGDTDSETSETLQVILDNPTNFALITDGVGIGTITGDDPIYIHDIQGNSYYSPILAAEGISGFNIASAGFVTVRAVVTAVDNVGTRQGFYIQEEMTDWDGNSYTSEGIFVMTRNDANVGTVVSGVNVGDLVQLSAQVMEYQAFSTMPRTVLVNSTGLSVISTGNALPVVTLTNIPNEVLTAVTPDYTDSSDGVGDTFDASVYALSYFETVEGMLVTIPNMVVADGFVSTSGGDPFLQAYSLDSANPDQINSRGGYTIAGDPPIGPPDTATTGDDTNHGGQHLHDGDVNPDIIELDFTDFATPPPAGLTNGASMGDQLGDVTGIIDFDFTDRKLFVTGMEPGGFVDGSVSQETTGFGGDTRALTVGAFNVNNLDPSDGAARFTAIANAIANNLHAPDIISIEEMQDNNGATNDGTTDASTTWQMLVDALNLATGAHYQWVDQAPTNGAEGGEPGGNIRVGFLYNTDRVQLGHLDANATLAERRMYTDRIGDGVRDAGDLIAYDDSMVAAEINTNDWASTRRSLLGEFTFHGNTVYVTANHFTAKGGSGEFWQFDQDLTAGDPTNAGWAKRSEQAEDVYSMLNVIQSGSPTAGIVSGGDYNDFYFYQPLTTLTGYTNADGTARVGGARFDNLTLTLSEAERYTYTFDGRSQAIDHIIVNDLLAGVAGYDVVHLNTGFNPNASLAISDHDPGLATFDFRSFSEALFGTAGADLIDGFGGNDSIFGLAGNDTLIGGSGTDQLVGGADNDIYVVDGAADAVTELGGGGNDVVYALVSYQLTTGTDIERLSSIDWTLTGALNLTGNELVNLIEGNAGANMLNGAAGADTMVGFGGNDIYVVDNAGDQVIEGAGQGNDVVYALADYALTPGSEVERLSSIDWTQTGALNLTGNGNANLIEGNAGANVLNGAAGADTLVGFGGNDIYVVDNAGDQVIESVGGGNDVVYALANFTLNAGAEVERLSSIDWTQTGALNLTGNEFANAIDGNAGANILDGGGGADTLVGFGGADMFAFTTALGAGNADLIADFSAVDDTIGLDDAIFTQIGGPGALNANAFFVGSAAHDADDRIIYNSATGQLFYDADGNGGGAAVLFATVIGAPALTVSDFQVI